MKRETALGGIGDRQSTFVAAAVILLIVLNSPDASAQLLLGEERVVKEAEVNGPRSLQAMDMDGDGDLDVLFAAYGGVYGHGKVGWFENVGEGVKRGPQHVIEDREVPLASAFASDLDGDGDFDVLVSGFRGEYLGSAGGTVAWFENENGRGRFGEKLVLSPDASTEVLAADLDSDGDQDVVAVVYTRGGGGGHLGWYENGDGNGTFLEPQIVSSVPYNFGSVSAKDLDGDGDLDLLAVSRGEIVWYENLDGAGNFSPMPALSEQGQAVVAVFAADVDGNGDIDLLYGKGNPDGGVSTELRLRYNTGGAMFGGSQLLVSIPDTADNIIVRSSDVDGDGDNDVLFAHSRRWHGRNQVMWIENTGNSGPFVPRGTLTSDVPGVTDVVAGDLDGDGDLDVLTSSEFNDKIAWFENEDGRGKLDAQHIIAEEGDEAELIVPVDLDADGDVDLVTSSPSHGKIGWYENMDGSGRFADQIVFHRAPPAEYGDRADRLLAEDFNRDGRLDILAVSVDGAMSWFENDEDEDGVLLTRRPVADSDNAGDGVWDGVPADVFAADIDADGDLDLITHRYDRPTSDIIWYENSDGRGTFLSAQILDQISGFYESLAGGDLDGDEDVDLLFSTRDRGGNRTLGWMKNGGFGMFEPRETLLPLEYELDIHQMVDLDADEDLDVLLLSPLAWHENQGNGRLGDRRVIIGERFDFRSGLPIDLDVDGDLDLLCLGLRHEFDEASEISYLNGVLFWHENVDAKGQFSAQQVIQQDLIGTFDQRPVLFAADLDGDGDPDPILSWPDRGRIVWYPNESVGTGADAPEIPSTSTRLSAPYPNPFRTTTAVTLVLDEADDVSVEVYDLLGRRVSVLFRGVISPGTERTFEFDAADHAAGVYVIRAAGERFRETRTVALQR